MVSLIGFFFSLFCPVCLCLLGGEGTAVLTFVLCLRVAKWYCDECKENLRRGRTSGGSR